MELRNHSPFRPFVFKARDRDGDTSDVVVVKGTYDLVGDRRLKISQEQEPVTVADEPYGDPLTTSLRRASDLAPFKPNGDLVVIGATHAPGGRPAATWLADLRLGPLRKTLRVFGPRRWRRALGLGWSLTDPTPVLRVPVRYELAYGGTLALENSSHAFEQNPIGSGYAPTRLPAEIRELDAPQIEDAREPIDRLDRTFAPAGFGFIGRSWQPRLGYAGTYDQAWLDRKWPLSPDDWDDAFNNAAHPDLTHPGPFQGGEELTALAMTPSGSASFTLPKDRIEARFRYRDGRIVTHPTVLDTCVVDFELSKVMCTFRARVREAGAIRVIELLMRRD